ncbi:MAG TPA: hypothetical protein VH475_28525 [Tepidisphaeraceae bacterium]|jgi:hypothetical protein
MKRRLLFVLLALCVVGPAARADGGNQQAGPLLTEAQLKAIIARPHSDKELVRGLRIYPKGRELLVSVTATAADGSKQHTEVAVQEKWVDGTYIVSEIANIQPGRSLYMVESWDEQTGLYRKYTVFSDTGLASVGLGVRIGEARSVSWLVEPAGKAAGPRCVSVSVSTDQRTTWRAVFARGGVVEQVQEGQARVVAK